MQPVEQIFLQVQLHDAHWKSLVAAKTDAVHPVDHDEIRDWFTGSEEEVSIRCDPFNLFFHPLPSGQYALGIIYSTRKTVPETAKQSKKLYVHILIIPPQFLLDNGNHPIAMFETFRHQIPFFAPVFPAQHIRSEDQEQIAPIVSATRFSPINADLMEMLTQRLGAMSLAQLMQSLFNAECTLFTSKSVSSLSVLSVLFDLLPIHYRPELAFSSDFFFTAKNSFRLSGFSKLQQRTIRLMRQWGVPVISLEQGNTGAMETLDPWARFVYQILQTKNFAFLNKQWSDQYYSAMLTPLDLEPVIWDNLHEVGISLSKAMLLGALPEKHISATEFSTHTLEELRCVAAVEQMIPMLNIPLTISTKLDASEPVGNGCLATRFPQYQKELSELEISLRRAMSDDRTAVLDIRTIWNQLLLQMDADSKDSIQESIIAFLHAALNALHESTEQRLKKTANLLELMMLFLSPTAEM